MVHKTKRRASIPDFIHGDTEHTGLTSPAHALTDAVAHALVDSGIATLTIAANAAVAASTVPFAQPFSAPPRVWAWSESGFLTTTNYLYVPILSPDGASVIWTNMPAAVTELLGLTIHRSGVSLVAATTARIVVNVIVAGVAGSTLRAQYSVNSGSTWASLTNTVSIAATGINFSGGLAVPAAAKTLTTWIRVVGAGGDGTADPEFGNILVEWSSIFNGMSVHPSLITATDFSLNASRFMISQVAQNVDVAWFAFGS